MGNELSVFDEQVSTVFKPVVVDIPKLIDECKGLKISGVDDTEGYAVVFASLQKLKKARTDVTKFAKSLRDEYTHKNRKIREIEGEYLALIEPVENELKGQREAIDEAKKKAERLILLPGRKKMLEDISIKMTDDEILSFDETQFATMYTSAKQTFDEAKMQEETRILEEARIKKEQEAEKVRIEQEKEAAVAQAKIDAEKAAAQRAKEAEAKAEKDKQDAIDKLKREQEDAEKARLAAVEKAEEDARIFAEQERIAEEERVKKAEKNKQYMDWVKEMGVDTASGDKIERVGDTFIAYKKVGEIVIK